MERRRLTFRQRPARSAKKQFRKLDFRGGPHWATPFSCKSCLMYDSSPMSRKIIYALLVSLVIVPAIAAQKRPVPPPTLLQIVKAEDERRWDDVLRNLLSNSNPSIRI